MNKKKNRSNIVINLTEQFTIISKQMNTNPLPEMITYTEQSHPNLYNEILKDCEWRWGKFNPNPYPMLNNKDTNSPSSN